MRKYFSIVLLLFISFSACAQTADMSLYDTMHNVQLKEVLVRARWKNDTDRYRYNQMKYYVTTILPYLNAATTLFKEINAKFEEPGLSKRDRKEFVSNKEDEMRTKFEDKVPALNVTQGMLLVKLIARQTDMNIYKLLKEFKNPIVALKWQAWARLHGMNLDRRYDPEDEPDLENIMYELGYPLPVSYAIKN
jgi:Domain of unknown function (DUF4294)